MRKILIFALLFVMVTSLISCQVIDRIRGKDEPVVDDPIVTPDNPENASDTDKLNRMLDDLRASVTLPEGSSEIPDIIMNELSGLNFSLEDIELDGERSGASVIFKNNTLYICNGGYAEQIIRFSEHGILSVSEGEDGVTSSLVTFDQLFESLPSSDVQTILDALVVKQGDLQKTDTEHVYTVNRSLLLRLGKALSGNSDFTIDKNSAPKITLDMREYDSANALKISIYDKSTGETTSITLSITKTEGNTKIELNAVSDNISLCAVAIFNNALKQLDVEYKMLEGENIASDFLLNYTMKADNSSLLHLEASEDGMSIRADVSISALNSITDLTATVNAPESEGSGNVTVDIRYDSSAVSKVGETVIEARIEYLGTDSCTRMIAEVYTEEYSDTSALYGIRIYSLESQSYASATGGAAKVYFPAKSEPKISRRASLYFNHGSNIITNYPAYLAKAEALNNQMISLLSTSRPSASQWMTYDSVTGIYYITTVTYSNGAYVSTTYSTPDAFRYAYGCAQNLGAFTKEGSSLAEREARRLAGLMELDIPEGASDTAFGSFYAYTYIAEYDVYLLFAADFPSDFVLLSEDPAENDAYNGVKIHKITYDQHGNVKMHTYEEQISEWNCCVTHKCSYCGISIYSYDEYTYKHNYIANAYETGADGDKLWEFVYCDRCGKCEVNIFKGELTVTLALEEMSESILSEIRRHAGMEEFTLSTDDFTHSLVVVRIEFSGEFTASEPFEIVFPELSKHTEYRIIGIDDAMYSYSNRTPLAIVLSNEVEFINEMAFMYCNYLTSVTASPSLKFIGRMAFYGSENLTQVIFDADSVYVGESAFSNTPVQTTT